MFQNCPEIFPGDFSLSSTAYAWYFNNMIKQNRMINTYLKWKHVFNRKELQLVRNQIHKKKWIGSYQFLPNINFSGRKSYSCHAINQHASSLTPGIPSLYLVSLSLSAHISLLGRIVWNGLTLFTTWVSNNVQYIAYDEIRYPFTNLNGAIFEVWNEYVIPSHTLRSMWLIIHAEIKVNPC